jgi:hypothetical protein
MAFKIANKPKRGRPVGSRKSSPLSPHRGRDSRPLTASPTVTGTILVHRLGLCFRQLGESTLQGVYSGQIYQNVPDDFINSMTKQGHEDKIISLRVDSSEENTEEFDYEEEDYSEED